MMIPTINSLYPMKTVTCILVDIVNIVKSSVEAISGYPCATVIRRYFFAHLKDHMQHRVLPRVNMKREIVPRVTTVGRYDIDVVRNRLLCIPYIGSSGMPRPTMCLGLVQANISSHLPIIHVDALHHL